LKVQIKVIVTTLQKDIITVNYLLSLKFSQGESSGLEDFSSNVELLGNPIKPQELRTQKVELKRPDS
jgi:hypothetical protein